MSCGYCGGGGPKKPAHFGAQPGFDEYLGPLRHWVPYGRSIFGQIVAPFGIRAGVQPIGAGEYYAQFGAHFWQHADRGRALVGRRG